MRIKERERRKMKEKKKEKERKKEKEEKKLMLRNAEKIWWKKLISIFLKRTTNSSFSELLLSLSLLFRPLSFFHSSSFPPFSFFFPPLFLFLFWKFFPPKFPSRVIHLKKAIFSSSNPSFILQ